MEMYIGGELIDFSNEEFFDGIQNQEWVDTDLYYEKG